MRGRGLLKAAALLSAHLTSSFVIPEPEAVDTRPSNPIVEYVLSSQDQAELRFLLDNVEPDWGFPVLQIEVGTTERLCAESNLTLDGRQLDSSWNGIQGTGEGTLEAYGNAPMSWTVTCLWDSQNPEGGSIPDLGTITHLLTLKLRDIHGRRTSPAFTIAYKQFGQPSILRFEPRYTVPTTSNADYPEWRTPVYPFVVKTPSKSQPPELLESPEPPEAPLSLAVAETQQKSLMKNFDKIKNKLSEKVHTIFESLKKINVKFCPKKAAKAQAALEVSHENESQYDEDLDVLDADTVSSDVKVATAVHQHPASQTRALHDAPTSTSMLGNEINTHEDGIPPAVILKSFFLSLIVLSCLTWIILRYRDPRRRAERAAYLEECRTKRLYRRAARRQKVVNMIWNFRMRYGLVSSTVFQEDEKRRRVIEQEGVLENVVEAGIQALREAHRAVLSMTSRSATDAEEGRAGFVYEIDQSAHRRARSVRSTRSTRSMSTLPEYESEGSRPPSYREMGRRDSLSGFTSDSSVVSTSPRISRDGTNSDYDEKVEDLNLDDVGPEDMRRRL